MVPTCGLMDQLTVVAERPTTVALNCWVSPPLRMVALRGLTVAPACAAGIMVTAASATWLGSATLFAVILKVSRAVIGTGAVYCTLVVFMLWSVPGVPSGIENVTEVLLVPVTVAVNVADWPSVRDS